ncbi:MAG: hypothetical protein ACE5FS_00370 [Paracoccaceae bacterium]
MRTGASISAAAHLALILLVIFGGPIIEHRKQKRLQIADVTLISAAEFDAAASRAPRLPSTDAGNLTEPGADDNAVAIPVPENTPELEASAGAQAPSREDAPDLSAVARAPGIASSPATTVTEAAPAITPADAPETPADTALSPVDGPALPEALAMNEPPAPSDAPRVDATAAPKPPADALRADTAQPEIAPEEIALKPLDERPPLAPPEATTEISPEPVENPPSSASPLRSRRPRARPASVTAKARAARETPAEEVAIDTPRPATPEPEPEPAVPQDPSPQPPATPTPSQPALASGPPLTGGEIDGLRLSIKKCWSVPAGLRNAEELEVVVAVTLSREGKVVGNAVRWIEPADQSDPRFKSAFRAARRAILRCQPYDMPGEKYAQWKELEVVFNPKGMKGLW